MLRLLPKILVPLALFYALSACCKREAPRPRAWDFSAAYKECFDSAPKEFRAGDGVNANYLSGCLNQSMK